MEDSTSSLSLDRLTNELDEGTDGESDRVAEPEEVTPVVALLASDAASYITGATDRIDGGGIPTIDV